jgi:tRNA (guanine-N7-)-methyltransferase
VGEDRSCGRHQERVLIDSHPERRRQQLYGRRKGPKLTAHQSALREILLPQLTLDLAELSDPLTCFSPPHDAESLPRTGCGVEARSASGGGKLEDIWLEVGFGAGEHLIWQAEHHPHVGFIGAEPYESGVAKLLSRLDRQPLANIRIHEGDARDVIAALPDSSIGRVFILFPDPWPKTRHHKRRFVQTDLLTALARIMKPGAELRFASDDADYLEWSLERLMRHPAFEWTASCKADWTTRPADWPPTRYEEKALHGPPAYLRFTHRAKVKSA